MIYTPEEYREDEMKQHISSASDLVETLQIFPLLFLLRTEEEEMESWSRRSSRKKDRGLCAQNLQQCFSIRGEHQNPLGYHLDVETSGPHPWVKTLGIRRTGMDTGGFWGQSEWRPRTRRNVGLRFPRRELDSRDQADDAGNWEDKAVNSRAVMSWKKPEKAACREERSGKRISFSMCLGYQNLTWT